MEKMIQVRSTPCSVFLSGVTEYLSEEHVCASEREPVEVMTA